MGKKNAKLRRKAKWTKSRQWNTCTAAQRVAAALMAASAVGRGSKTTYITTVIFSPKTKHVYVYTSRV